MADHPESLRAANSGILYTCTSTVKFKLRSDDRLTGKSAGWRGVMVVFGTNARYRDDKKD